MPSLPNRLASLLSSLTPNQIAAMNPPERTYLSEQCMRVMRLATIENAKAEARSLEVWRKPLLAFFRL